MKHGASLAPTFTFGEAFVYSNMFSNSKGSISHFIAKIGCPVPLFFGRGIFNYSFGVLPRRQPLTIVGKFLFSILFMKSNVVDILYSEILHSKVFTQILISLTKWFYHKTGSKLQSSPRWNIFSTLNLFCD